jgi:hypothetical protein
MSSSDVQARVGRALVDFAVKSQYPDEEAVIAADVESSALPVALELLSNARSSLEVGACEYCANLRPPFTMPMLMFLCLG